MRKQPKSAGAVPTPPELAEYLVAWAARGPGDRVLDAGAGEGVFLDAAFRRLLALGADPAAARRQLHGVERDPQTCSDARVWLAARGALPADFRCADLFDCEFPPVDALVGNPPYVRRAALPESPALRARLGEDLPGASDLSAYFVRYAASFLRPGGRLALVLSASFLDVDYGVALKRWLLAGYVLRGIALFEGRVFAGAEVKAALLFAERRPSAPGPVRFLRLAADLAGLPPAEQLLAAPPGRAGPAVVFCVEPDSLDARSPWGAYLKAEPATLALLARPEFVPLARLAESRIGLQTLAQSFFVLSRARAAAWGLPRCSLEPLAFGPREVSGPVLRGEGDVGHFAFHVRELTPASPAAVRRYVAEAERAVVRLRGKGEEVVGYHRVPRLIATGRQPWYSLVAEIERRGRYPILLPRRCFAELKVIWNAGGLLANENFVELRPRNSALLPALLATLHSTAFEVAVRVRGQLYGGGVLNLNPGDVRALPVLDIAGLAPSGLSALGAAYTAYLETSDRVALDRAVLGAFGLAGERRRLARDLDVLRALSRRSKAPSRLRPDD